MKQNKKFCSKVEPAKIFREHEEAVNFKNSIGKGIAYQSEKNERFCEGDQWRGVNCGDRPLVIYNIIRRIVEYKESMLGSSNVSVAFSADGVPNTIGMRENTEQMLGELSDGAEPPVGEVTSDEINVVMSALSRYFDTFCERVKFGNLKIEALHNAMISGTAVLYQYWDSTVKTGLYADAQNSMPIEGDVCAEILNIENVDFAVPTEKDIQKQPFIIIMQRMDIKAAKKYAKSVGVPKEQIEEIRPDGNEMYIGRYDRLADSDTDRVTVLTKLWKEKDGSVWETVVTRGVVIKKPHDIAVRMYPIAIFPWITRRDTVYGEAEVTQLIPNQIAINRNLSAMVHSVNMLGMPMMVQNKTLVPVTVTNEPGQVIEYSGAPGSEGAAVQYINPPQLTGNYNDVITGLIHNTLQQAGANDAALGNVRPDNQAAIIAVQEAANAPLQLYKRRFEQFIEDCARISAEFWIKMYGVRKLRIEDERGVWYMDFDGDRYADLIINANVDVGDANIYSQAAQIETLNSLRMNQMITDEEYFERVPKGLIPNIDGLIKSRKAAMQQQAAVTSPDMMAEGGDITQGLSPEAQAAFEQLPEEQKQQMLALAEQDGAMAVEGVPEEGAEEPDVAAMLDSLSPQEREAFLALPREKQMQILQEASGNNDIQ